MAKAIENHIFNETYIGGLFFSVDSYSHSFYTSFHQFFCLNVLFFYFFIFFEASVPTKWCWYLRAALPCSPTIPDPGCDDDGALGIVICQFAKVCPMRLSP